jgi:prepilin-type N-terminal cleavage/methylation domain-containing protein
MKRGFTIVELLIVIVVIGILAAITIVAYNGISNRAKQSAAQSGVSQAYKKVMAYAVQNSDTYPGDLVTAGVSDANDTSFQYSVNNSSSPRTFCVTATVGTVSYYENNTTQTSPASGVCPGHGVGGVPPVTNFLPNPSVETGITGYVANNTGTSIAPSTTRAYSGTSSILVTSLGVGSGYNGVRTTYTITGGKQYTLSAWVYLPAAFSTSGVAVMVSGGSIPLTAGNYVTTTGSWQRTQMTFTSSTTAAATFFVVTSSTGSVVAGPTFSVDAWQLAEGPAALTYGDGDSPGWAWTSTPHASSSTGPPL